MRKKVTMVTNVKKAYNTKLSLACIHNQDIIIKVSNCADHKSCILSITSYIKFQSSWYRSKIRSHMKELQVDGKAIN